MRRIIFHIIFFVLTCAATITSAQLHHAAFSHFNAASGLPSATVYACLQDRNGYLWLGTDAGVARFDGQHFVNYTTEDGLGDNEVLDLYEDRKGRVWFIPFSGKISYFAEGRLHHPDKDTLLLKLSSSPLECPTEDTEGNLYFLANNPARVLKLKANGDLQQLVLPYLKPQDIPYVLLKDTNETLYVIVHHGRIFRIDGQTFTEVTPAFPEIREHRFASNPKSKMMLSFNEKGIYGWKGLVPTLLVDFKQYPTGQSFNNTGAITLLMDRLGNIWQTRAHYPTLFFRKRNHGYDAGTTILGNRTTIVTQDREAQLWFCTQSDGIYKIPWSRLNQLLDAPAIQLLSGKAVTCMFTGPDSTVWIGTNDNTIARLKDQKIYYYKNCPGGINNRIRQIIADRKGNIHVVTDELLLEIRKTGKGYSNEVKETRYRDGSPVAAAVKTIAVDTAGIMYPLFLGRFAHHRILPGEHFVRKEPLPPWQEHNRIFTYFIDRDNVCYVSTSKGIGYILQDSIIYLEQPALYAGSCVNSYTQAPDGTVLMTTSGSGVLAVRKQKILAFLNKTNGLRGLICRKLHLRGDTAFIATNTGVTLARYSAGKFKVLRQLTQEQGLISDDVNDLAFTAQSLLVATSAGLSVLGLAKDAAAVAPPKVQLVHFLAGNKDYTQSRQIAFSNQQQYIRIGFIAPTMDHPEQVQYRFRLSSRDKDWQKTSANEMEFSHLPYGQYQFEIQAKKYNSGWSKSLYRPFTIIPPFYVSWWFRLLILAVLTAGFYLLYRYLLWKKMERQVSLLRQQKALEAERSRIASDLHDDIGSELTHITMLTNRLRSEPLTPDLLSRLEVSSGQAIRKMNEVVWTLHAQDDTLHNLASYLRAQAREYLVEHQIQHQLLVDEAVYIPLTVTATYRRQLTLILKELLHNIVKHAQAKLVVIKINYVAGILELTVSDDGVGFNSDKPGKGNGLSNIQKRVREIDGKCHMSTDKGTTVNITVPLNDPYDS